MGALAPVSSWIPEDDLLLKNAVEAGASLESLAKGAVKFSRRFTVHELQERWYSLLYDPAISLEASTSMIEIERPTSLNSSKVNKAVATKENKSTGKRKTETVKNSYYALRKRICSEPFENMDLSFLVGPGNNTYAEDVDGPLSAICDGEHPISDPFGLQVLEMDTVAHAFPDGLMDDSAFPTVLQDIGGENFQADQNNMHTEFSHILGEDMPPTGDPKELADDIFFETDDQVTADQSNMCLDFEDNKIFNSPVSECVAPFNNIEYSPLSGMSIWKTVSAPDLPVDIDIGDKDIMSGDNFQLPDDYDPMNTTATDYDIHLGVKVKMENDYDEFQVHNSPEGYLAEISNSLLNFTNEEELLMNGDGKDIIDKSYFDGLSSLLLNSPNDTCQEHAVNMTQTQSLVAPDVCPKDPPSLPHESNKVPDSCGEQVSFDVQIQMQLPISASNLEFPEKIDGVICCVLNTEDPDIPCNDVALQLLLRSRTAGISTPSSANDSAGMQRTGVIPKPVHKEQHITGDSRVSSQRLGSHAVQGTGQSPTVSNFGISKPKSADVPSRVSGVSYVGSYQINGAKADSERLLSEVQKERARVVLNSTDCSLNKSSIASASASYPSANFIDVKEENDAAVSIGDQDHVEPMSTNIATSVPVLNPPQAADQDGLHSESDEDDDIPYYSDIEAMILDMDLEPDVEGFLANEEVLRYQQEDTKRTIIRLEQSAHSQIQRAIASRGALAILYGRNSKHFVKKPEVLLGRATEENIVDIDLGREGRANKISRKQAIIKMDKGGSFSLKNLSKFPIWVNSKEVGLKQSIRLNSSCLIEIRGLAYIFETNPTCVKMYVDRSSNHNQ